MSAPAPTQKELRLSYALARGVPDMDRGFTIATRYGDIEVGPGPLATRIQSIVRQAIQEELEAPGQQA